MTVGMGQTVTLAQQAVTYGAIDEHGTLVVTSGDYYIDALTLQSQGTFHVDASAGRVRIYARHSLTWRGTQTPAGLAASQLEFIVEGAEVMIDAPSGFKGIIVARQAALAIHQSTRQELSKIGK